MSEEFKVGDIVSPSWEPTAIAVVKDYIPIYGHYLIQAIWRKGALGGVQATVGPNSLRHRQLTEIERIIWSIK